jgi:uncharacterized tellurite resistance protein B-like protein
MDEHAKTDLRNAMVMALADGKLTGEEKRGIESLRQRLGIDADEFRDLCEEVRRDPNRISLPREAAEARAALDLLIEIAAVDGQIQPAEQAVLHRVGEYVGLDTPEVDRLTDQALGADEVDQSAIEAAVEEVYAHFNDWDPATRQQKIDALADHGRAAVVPLLRVLESYRTPNGMPDALALKTLIARALGQIADPRTIYYLCQQVGLGDMDDEVTCAELRHACAEAVGKITRQPIPANQEGVEKIREWWLSEAGRGYDRLAL